MPLVKILWDFRLATTLNHPSNCPDIVLYDFRKQDIFFIEISCPADINVATKENEKINKYLPGSRFPSASTYLTRHMFKWKEETKNMRSKEMAISTPLRLSYEIQVSSKVS